MRTVRLKKNEDRRIRAGHLWVFSNEIMSRDQEYSPGEIVDIKSYAGRHLGRGYINPHSLITVRVLTREMETIDQAFFRKRIVEADALRRRLYPGEHAYRVVFGEADGLPGLVIDKYADVFVVQVSTLGMQVRLGELLGAISTSGLEPRAVVLRSDTPMAELEGFKGESRVLAGVIEGLVVIEQDGISFGVDVLEGQKTGFYLDQRENCRAAAELFKDLRVLDCFCYIGAWSLRAAAGGAKEVVGLDSSEKAIEAARHSAEMNSFDSVCRFEVADVFEQLSEMVGSGEKYDCVVLDPPALVKSKRHLNQGQAAYERINRLAMELLSANGVLISSSCSFHISRERFHQILSAAAQKAKRSVIVMEWRGQARDHPVLLAMPETSYLKCAIMRVT